MKHTPHFVVVDDDLFANSMTEMLLKDIPAFPEIPVSVFRNGNDALQYIQNAYNKEDAPLTIILLDLDMPEINGWQFLEKFEKLNTVIKSHFRICFYSSSIKDEDHERAFENSRTVDFYIKPIKKEQFISLINRVYK